MIEFLKMFFSKIWELFSIKWPGFEFSIGSVFLAAAVSVGALTAILKMVGVSFLGGFSDFTGRQLQHDRIKIAKLREKDTK